MIAAFRRLTTGAVYTRIGQAGSSSTARHKNERSPLGSGEAGTLSGPPRWRRNQPDNHQVKARHHFGRFSSEEGSILKGGSGTTSGCKNTPKHGLLASRVVLIWVLAVSVTALAADRHEITSERGVAVKMRDAVVLRADIYRPKTQGKFPVLLQRTPYDKAAGVDFGLKAAALGYVVIFQDTRGRYTSEGEWYPFKYESQDGYDTVEWAASLPYANGKVGMFGSSYIGATQMLAAIAQPPHLAGIFPEITASNYYDGWTYQSGAFEQLFSQFWTSYLALDTLNRRALQNMNFARWTWKVPLSNYPVLDVGPIDNLSPYFTDWLQHPSYDDYWRRWSIEEYYSKVTVPAYHVGGWYDIFVGGTLRNYVGLRAKGENERARRGQRLLIGPWYHGPYDGKAGEVDFGPEAKGDTDSVTLRWYDYLLKGDANGIDREKPVKIFVMGKNVWREEDDWPLSRARNTRFFLHSGGKANSLSGDGKLGTVSPQSETADQFVYDPSDPVPTRGGALCCGDRQFPAGAFDQRPIEARNDVLVYSTPSFREDFEVTGPISLELYASSSAVDTDFTAKLVDVWPNGFAQNLTDGILRARYRNSFDKAQWLNPGEIYKFTIDLWATSNVFLAGHQLRLEISSSNFPRFDRNSNTGQDLGLTTRMVKATNTIYHDREHPSALVLPVIGHSKGLAN
jgi:putative CocE/NonD family hydrolase